MTKRKVGIKVVIKRKGIKKSDNEGEKGGEKIVTKKQRNIGKCDKEGEKKTS